MEQEACPLSSSPDLSCHSISRLRGKRAFLLTISTVPLWLGEGHPGADHSLPKFYMVLG